jgi:hypothetical protein
VDDAPNAEDSTSHNCEREGRRIVVKGVTTGISSKKHGCVERVKG